MTDDDKLLAAGRALARAEHDDLSVADALCDRIEELLAKGRFEANYWHEEWVTQEAEARNAERERDALKSRCKAAEALLRKTEPFVESAWFQAGDDFDRGAGQVLEGIRAHLAALDKPAPNEPCKTCGGSGMVGPSPIGKAHLAEPRECPDCGEKP